MPDLGVYPGNIVSGDGIVHQMWRKPEDVSQEGGREGGGRKDFVEVLTAGRGVGWVENRTQGADAEERDFRGGFGV